MQCRFMRRYFNLQSLDILWPNWIIAALHISFQWPISTGDDDDDDEGGDGDFDDDEGDGDGDGDGDDDVDDDDEFH